MILYRILHIPSATCLRLNGVDDYFEDTTPFDLDEILSMRPFFSVDMDGRLTLEEIPPSQYQRCELINLYRHEFVISEIEVEGLFKIVCDSWTHAVSVMTRDGFEKSVFHSIDEADAYINDCSSYIVDRINGDLKYAAVKRPAMILIDDAVDINGVCYYPSKTRFPVYSHYLSVKSIL